MHRQHPKRDGEPFTCCTDRHGRPWVTLEELLAYDPDPAGWGDEQRFLCFFTDDCQAHQGRDHRSLCVNALTGLFQCKRCGGANRLRDHCEREWEQERKAKRRPGRSWRRAQAPRALTPPARTTPQSAAGETEHIIGETERPIGWWPDDPAVQYLQRRGFPEDLCMNWPCVLSDRDWHGHGPAVIFCAYGEKRGLVALQGRLIQPRSGRTMHNVGSMRDGVFWTPYARGGTCAIAVAESPLDAMSLHIGGLPAVALFGCRNRPSWLRRELKFRRIYIATDADSAGDEAAAQLVHWFQIGEPPRRLRPPAHYKDWNAFLMASGPSALHVSLRMKTAQGDLISYRPITRYDDLHCPYQGGGEG